LVNQIARREDGVIRSGLDGLSRDFELKTAVQDEKGLVLAPMDVRGDVGIPVGVHVEKGIGATDALRAHQDASAMVAQINERVRASRDEDGRGRLRL
jgi:hypothetical protein